MTVNTTIPSLERLAFFEGQRLTDADLSALQTYLREIDRLHNRALHSWGIAMGFEVTGSRGERTVMVQPGYALDCNGRELVLSSETTLEIPADSERTSYFLTVSYAEDADLTAVTRAGVCHDDGAVRRPERSHLRWMDPNGGDFEKGIDIVLGSIEVENCRLAADVSADVRRDARPAQQPLVAAGASEAGLTVWEPWVQQIASGDDVTQERRVGISTVVNTAEAGFRQTPRYLAHVLGARTFTVDAGDEQEFQFVVDGYAHVASATPFSFELFVHLPQLPSFGTADFPSSFNPGFVVSDDFMPIIGGSSEDTFEVGDVGQLNGLEWRVVWLGVEGG